MNMIIIIMSSIIALLMTPIDVIGGGSVGLERRQKCIQKQLIQYQNNLYHSDIHHHNHHNNNYDTDDDYESRNYRDRIRVKIEQDREERLIREQEYRDRIRENYEQRLRRLYEK